MVKKEVKSKPEKENISISIKRTCWEKIQSLKAHPNQRHGEIVEDLVEQAIKKK